MGSSRAGSAETMARMRSATRPTRALPTPVTTTLARPWSRSAGANPSRPRRDGASRACRDRPWAQHQGLAPRNTAGLCRRRHDLAHRRQRQGEFLTGDLEGDQFLAFGGLVAARLIVILRHPNGGHRGARDALARAEEPRRGQARHVEDLGDVGPAFGLERAGEAARRRPPQFGTAGLDVRRIQPTPGRRPRLGEAHKARAAKDDGAGSSAARKPSPPGPGGRGEWRWAAPRRAGLAIPSRAFSVPAGHGPPAGVRITLGRPVRRRIRRRAVPSGKEWGQESAGGGGGGGGKKKGRAAPDSAEGPREVRQAASISSSARGRSPR